MVTGKINNFTVIISSVLIFPLQISAGISVRVNNELQDQSFSYFIMSGDSVTISMEQHHLSDWFLITPVRKAYSNLNSTDDEHGLRVDSLKYTIHELRRTDESVRFIAGTTPCFPECGTFYIARDIPYTPADTITALEPLHTLYPSEIVQFSIRTDDTYMGYLMELMNTPFIMTPRNTPGGNHQADDRLGSDCAAFAIYGRRREGYDFRYLGPRGIYAYLEPLYDEQFYPSEQGDIYIYMSESGNSIEIREEKLQPGDILHFCEQVSVFYEDRGIEGLLDSEDILIQSWFNGPHFCMIRENGFFGLPVSVYRWID
ncbi:MAG: hypothetical protein KAW14_05750 [Candidatus Aegiribacteria sp.]|nr:hypothetical protein [Candidatus Aegiribacteria sp.]